MQNTEDRKRIRCHFCQLPQFVSRTGCCVKCHRAYPVAVLAKESVPTLDPTPTVVSKIDVEPELNTGLLVGRVYAYSTIMPILIAAIRTQQGLSQAEMARRMKISRTYITRLENWSTSPVFASVFKIAKAFGMSAAQFMRMADFLVYGQ